eukprot:GHVU01224692.1.p1 GENE.GHVU01224692.1~~GHVU01224692.1.p1  ORF type:complete len:252 (+),score=61.85 GHVU01224692.1:116-871(+)
MEPEKPAEAADQATAEAAKQAKVEAAKKETLKERVEALRLKKEKEKDKLAEAPAVAAQEASQDAAKEASGPISGPDPNAVFVPGPVHSYDVLLERIQNLIRKNNPDLRGAKKYKLAPPQVVRVQAKKIAWMNFSTICASMNRPQEHVRQFVLSELGTLGDIARDGSYDGQLILKGKFGPKHFESLLRKYIKEYVTCTMCKSPNTTMEKDSKTRLYTMVCHACNANKTVTTIKSGFHAVSKGDRKKAKEALG